MLIESFSLMKKNKYIASYNLPLTGFSLPELLIYMALFSLIGTFIWSAMSSFYVTQYRINALQNLTNETNLTLRKLRFVLAQPPQFTINGEGSCVDLVATESSKIKSIRLKNKDGGDYYAFFTDTINACNTIGEDGARISDYIFVKRDTDKEKLLIVDGKNPNYIQFNLNSKSTNSDLTSAILTLNQGLWMSH